MNIFKFGGMSIKDAEAIRNTANVIGNYGEAPLIIVVSAMGKTTNALEDLTKAFFRQEEGYYQKFEAIKNDHFQVISELFGDESNEVFDEVNDLFVEIEWIIEDQPVESYGYLYDQIVSIGELASTQILSGYLNQQNIGNTWRDVRDLIKTDNAYQQARILWDETTEAVKNAESHLKSGVSVTQGFLGCTSENFTTTLGREGSDFSAAIFAYLLDAEKMTVWKDVPGILNADPNQFDNTQKIDHLSYLEAVEMTYYGAKVIHPKTIKPLENKQIPLHIRSFINPEESGTFISKDPIDQDKLPPVIVFKREQLLLNLRTKDFSFIAEENLSMIYQIFARHRIGLNMMQVGAITFSACVNEKHLSTGKLLAELENHFSVETHEDLDLLTIRHYDDQTLAQYTQGRKCKLTQKDRVTVQCLMI